MVASRQLQPADMVLKEGMQKWVLANSIKGLFAESIGVSSPHVAQVAPEVLPQAIHHSSEPIPAWYCVRDGQKYGPFSVEQMKEMTLNGRLQPTDIVWNQDMEHWAAASTVQAFFPVASVAPLETTPRPQQGIAVADEVIPVIVRSFRRSRGGRCWYCRVPSPARSIQCPYCRALVR